MIVSWNWLKDYVKLDMQPAELEHRLAMSGLNHEATEAIGDDLAIDLEVTSNRPDCLGHLGIAREISVLWDLNFTVPKPTPQESGESVHSACQVAIECPDLCYRYTARVIRGVNVGPSPPWLASRLHTLGIAVINNVVDSTNYVMMECGQPLHAFDLAKIRGGQIVVRDARRGEQFGAIDHRTYELHPGMCVDCRPVTSGCSGWRDGRRRHRGVRWNHRFADRGGRVCPSFDSRHCKGIASAQPVVLPFRTRDLIPRAWIGQAGVCAN